MANNKSKKNKLKRLQQAQGPLPFGGPLLPPPTPAPIRGTLQHTMTPLEEERWNNHTLLTPIDNLLSITVGLYKAQVEGNSTIPTVLNHYSHIMKVQEWLTQEPELFVAEEKDASPALAWSQDFRLCIAHEWIGRLLDYRNYHLSAVALLASKDMMNDAKTETLTRGIMNGLKITQLKIFPAVPPTPK